MRNIPTGHKWARRIALVVTGVLVLMLADWVLTDPLVNLETDWTAFDKAADRVVAGEEVYRPYNAETEPLPYLYPPFALLLTLPLALTGFYGSFLISAIVTFLAFVVGLRLFARSESRPFDATTGMIVATASGSVVSSTLIGQYSGLYVLAFGVAAHLWATNRQVLAGIAFGLLWLKPNLAIAVPVVLVWSRSWRALKGFGLGTGLVALLSLPFGIDQWRGFVDNAKMMAELQQADVVPYEKMVSILGAAHTMFGFGTESPATFVVFGVTALVLGFAVLALWTPDALAKSHLRAFGGLAVFIVAANPRLYFYDATLVAMGMFGLWAAAHTCGGAIAKRWLPLTAAATWFFLWGGPFVELNRWVGVLAAAGLIASAVDSRHWESKTEGLTAVRGGLEGSETVTVVSNTGEIPEVEAA